MPKLVVNPGTQQAFELKLKSGVNSIGRSPENDLPIDHASISDRHCEILVGETGATLFDLESARGTVVDGQRVEQAALRDGQSFMLGEVAFFFFGDGAGYDAPTAHPTSVPAPLQVSTTCRFHPKSLARFSCGKCAKAYCPLCVGHQVLNGQNVVCCRQCGSACVELALVVEETGPLPFGELVAGAFKYPLQNDGWILLASGTVFYLFLSFLGRGAGFAGPYGFVAGLTIGIFGAGYLVAYLQKLVAASAMGEDRMPDWPDFENWQEDIVAPLLQTIGLIAFCFWPVILCQYFVPKDANVAILVSIAAWGFGLLYLPMAMLAVFMADSITAINPLIVIPAIIRLRAQYWIVCALLGAVLLASVVLQAGLEMLLPIPVVPALFSGFASLYFLTVGMRVLGLMHWCNREKLGWVKG